jgi:hypothetical protein
MFGRVETGRLILQPGQDQSLRQLGGWSGVELWARVRSLGAGFAPVRFRASREGGGSRIASAHGVLFATPASLAGQVLTVRDQADLIDLRVSLRFGADPVEIEWIAHEPTIPPIASSVAQYDLLPVGGSGTAVTPRTDLWGRTLVTAVPPQSTFHKRFLIPDGDPYSAPLLTPAEIFSLLAAASGDKLAGLIAITGFLHRSAGGGTFKIENTTLTVPGHGPLLVEPTGLEGAVRHNFPSATPPLFRFDSVLGFYPVMTSAGEIPTDSFSVEVFGHVLLDAANGES